MRIEPYSLGICCWYEVTGSSTVGASVTPSAVMGIGGAYSSSEFPPEALICCWKIESPLACPMG